MLMCYLRVCPFTKAIGENCKIEKREDQCCPVITCPEVPVHLLTSTTTASPSAATDSTELGHLDNYGCTLNELFYSDGARVPSDPSKPCELCYCIRNKTTCIMQECTLHVQGCKPVYQDGVCCPVRYDCGKFLILLLRLHFLSKVVKLHGQPHFKYYGSKYLHIQKILFNFFVFKTVRFCFTQTKYWIFFASHSLYVQYIKASIVLFTNF